MSDGHILNRNAQTAGCLHFVRSIVESISYLHVDLPRLCIVRPTNRGANVEQESPIRQVQHHYRERQVFGYRFTKREGESCVLLQMRRNVTRPIGESGAVVHVSSCKRAPWKAGVESGMQRNAPS